ncbi:transcriptional regulator, XRE family protein [Crocosphaera chwakensis CCY0110]|uniref:Transcriptional regulator, XRE family protein n=1 Tax=Crocosphaera chwakensis CCY0110 TaxID=391612 RepID=A3ISN9_9CHRO|nr:transcriptional regulator, XRE family protein [Crocosphaera chwakensis CCY0110]
MRSLLINARQSANLTQTELSKRLNKPQSYVSKYERGERRLDVIEFLEVCNALNIDPVILLKKLINL